MFTLVNYTTRTASFNKANFWICTFTEVQNANFFANFCCLCCSLALTELQQPSGVVQCPLQRPLLVDWETQVVQDVDAVHLGGRLSLIQLPQGLKHPQLSVVVIGLWVRHPAQVEAVVHGQHGPLGAVQGPAWVGSTHHLHYPVRRIFGTRNCRKHKTYMSCWTIKCLLWEIIFTKSKTKNRQSIWRDKHSK